MFFDRSLYVNPFAVPAAGHRTQDTREKLLTLTLFIDSPWETYESILDPRKGTDTNLN